MAGIKIGSNETTRGRQVYEVNKNVNVAKGFLVHCQLRKTLVMIGIQKAICHPLHLSRVGLLRMEQCQLREQASGAPDHGVCRSSGHLDNSHRSSVPCKSSLDYIFVT